MSKIYIPMFKVEKQGEKLPMYSYSMKDGEAWLSVARMDKKVSKAGKEYLQLEIDGDNLKRYLAEQKAYKEKAKPEADNTAMVNDMF